MTPRPHYRIHTGPGRPSSPPAPAGGRGCPDAICGLYGGGGRAPLECRSRSAPGLVSAPGGPLPPPGKNCNRVVESHRCRMNPA